MKTSALKMWCICQYRNTNPQIITTWTKQIQPFLELNKQIHWYSSKQQDKRATNTALNKIHHNKLCPPAITHNTSVTLTCTPVTVITMATQQTLHLHSLSTMLIGSRSWGNGAAPEDSWSIKATKVRARKAGRTGRGGPGIGLMLAEDGGPHQKHMAHSGLPLSS